MIQVGLQHFLVVSALLFTFGLVCVLTRKNAVAILIGIEMILNSASINLVAFSRYGDGGIEGSIFVLFIIVLAAAEAVVALALILALQRRLKTVDVDQTDSLKG
jgi:NADH-quinone oxidoreductase subunit K